MSNVETQYYANKNSKCCCNNNEAVPLDIYLLRNNYLSEYLTESEKLKIRENLGIDFEKISELINTINEQVLNNSENIENLINKCLEIKTISATDATIFLGKYTNENPVYVFPGENIKLVDQDSAFFYNSDKELLSFGKEFESSKALKIYIAFNRRLDNFSYAIILNDSPNSQERRYTESLGRVDLISEEDILNLIDKN